MQTLSRSLSFSLSILLSLSLSLSLSVSLSLSLLTPPSVDLSPLPLDFYNNCTQKRYGSMKEKSATFSLQTLYLLSQTLYLLCSTDRYATAMLPYHLMAPFCPRFFFSKGWARTLDPHTHPDLERITRRKGLCVHLLRWPRLPLRRCGRQALLGRRGRVKAVCHRVNTVCHSLGPALPSTPPPRASCDRSLCLSCSRLKLLATSV